MPLSRSRDYLSIGEVLEAVRAEFPDISISKIRFLEAEGLITPERTGAGYRKFYDKDLARLRYILSLQRDHFLPLKVIRERLQESGEALPEPGAAPPLPEPETGNGRSHQAPQMTIPTDLQLDRSALAEASGLDERQLAGLQEFGLVSDDSGYYDGTDLTVAKAARRLFDYGIEPRHLRMYRQWAEREASFFEQIVTPISMRKDPSSRLQASQSVRELLDCSRQIREAMLRTSLRELL
ncbi:MAG: transcriptional regulator FtsR [Actinomycetota bacterium]